jgi:hypothetical protein
VTLMPSFRFGTMARALQNGFQARTEMLSYLLAMAYIQVCDQLGRPIAAFRGAPAGDGLPVRH